MPVRKLEKEMSVPSPIIAYDFIAHRGSIQLEFASAEKVVHTQLLAYTTFTLIVQWYVAKSYFPP